LQCFVLAATRACGRPMDDVWGTRPSMLPLTPRPPPPPVPHGSSENGETEGQPPAMKRVKRETGVDHGEVLEVRFAATFEAERALEFNGTLLHDVPITVHADITSKDGTKVLVQGLPVGVSHEELRDHFSGAGTVLFVGPPWRPHVPNSWPSNCGATDFSVAEVRYDSPEEAQRAVESLDGSELGGVKVSVMLDQSSKDGSKILVTGLPTGVPWQTVKDYCSQGGQVAYVNVRQPAHQGVSRTSSGIEGEVRFESPSDAAAALKQLQGSWLGDRQIWLSMDPSSKDQTRLLASGLAPFIQWQELKDHFSCIGSVAFAQVKSDAGFAQPPGGFNQGFASTGVRSGNSYGAWGGGSKGAYGKAMYPAKGMWGHPYPYDFTACRKGGYGKGAGKRPFRPMVADGNRGTCSGEVRYDNSSLAQAAVEKLSGSFLHGAKLAVELDVSSKDGSKVFVHGIPAGCQWQELKDHFGQLGQVAFAAIVGPCEVRMETPEDAQQALEMLNGTEVMGSVISVLADRTSKDGTRLLVCGLPLSCAWQEVKDLFGQAGTVAFVSRPGGGK